MVEREFVEPGIVHLGRQIHCHEKHKNPTANGTGKATMGAR
jgi:hypothetical protein